MRLEGVTCQICATEIATVVTRYQTARRMVIQGRRRVPSNSGFLGHVVPVWEKNAHHPHQRMVDTVIGKILA